MPVPPEFLGLTKLSTRGDVNHVSVFGPRRLDLWFDSQLLGSASERGVLRASRGSSLDRMAIARAFCRNRETLSYLQYCPNNLTNEQRTLPDVSEGDERSPDLHCAHPNPTYRVQTSQNVIRTETACSISVRRSIRRRIEATTALGFVCFSGFFDANISAMRSLKRKYSK